MYGKIFQQIYDSSIAEDPKVRFTFMDLIVLADSDGVVDMTHEAIARRTNVDIEWVRRSIAALEGPDPKSRSPNENGARIIRMDDHRDWGWIIVNFDRFRAVATDEQRREKTKLRVRKHRSNQINASDSNTVTPCNASVTPPYASASASVQEKGVQGEEDKREDIYQAYPRKVGKPDALRAITKAVQKFGSDFVLAKTREYAAARVGQDPQFTPHPSTWFNQERFNDDPSTWKKKVVQEAKVDDSATVMGIMRRNGLL